MFKLSFETITRALFDLVIMVGAMAAVITAMIAVQKYFADKTKEAITTAVAPIVTRLDGIDSRLNKIDQRLERLEIGEHADAQHR